MSRCENRLGIRDEHLTRSTVNSRIRPYYDNRTHKILSSFLQKEKNQRKRTSRPATSFHSISSRSFDNLPLRYFPTTNSNVLKSNADRTATGHHRCVGQFLEGRRTVRPTVFPYHSPTIRSDSIPGGGGVFSRFEERAQSTKSVRRPERDLFCLVNGYDPIPSSSWSKHPPSGLTSAVTTRDRNKFEAIRTMYSTREPRIRGSFFSILDTIPSRSNWNTLEWRVTGLTYNVAVLLLLLPFFPLRASTHVAVTVLRRPLLLHELRVHLV